MIKAVFFDVANTLLDKPDLYPNMQQVLLKHGHNVPARLLAERHRLLSEVIEFPDKTSKAFYDTFNAQLLLMLGILPAPELVTALFDACTYLPWRAFDDVAHVQTIGLPKGVISNWDATLRAKLQEHTPIAFQWVLGSQEMQVRKPSLEFYSKVIELTGLSPDEILYVGDSIKLDIQPALSLGIRAVLIDRLNLYAASSLARITQMQDLNMMLS
jgi:FMN phosphatase YigB (HAD superfamily)